MIDDFDPLPDLPPWRPPEQLLKLERPMHEALPDFVHGCSPDPATRTVAVTTLVLSLWQLHGQALTLDVPSLLLVDASESEADPIDQFSKSLVYTKEDNRPRVQTEGAFMQGSIDLAPKAMRNALLKRRSLGRIAGDNIHKAQEAQGLVDRFNAAKRTGYGHGCCRSYSTAWHPDYGLLTDDDDQLILRLNTAPDRAAFRRDLLDDPAKLLLPTGIDRHLSMVPKGISLSGSLTPDLCDGELASKVLALSPFFLLPHTTGDLLDADKLRPIEVLAATWKHGGVPPVAASLKLSPSPWIQAYQTALRKRLANLPGTYEFAVLQAVHQLDGICERIVNFAARGSQARTEELVALCQDLYAHTLRGIVISVAGLSYNGLGLHLGSECEPLRDKAFKMLKHLRKKGSSTASDLLRNLHLKKLERDALLERLAEENLVIVEDGEVTATTYRAFVEGLHSRAEFLPVENHWARAKAVETATA